MDCSLLLSSVRGILQARMLEWVAMPSSRESLILPEHYAEEPKVLLQFLLSALGKSPVVLWDSPGLERHG